LNDRRLQRGIVAVLAGVLSAALLGACASLSEPAPLPDSPAIAIGGLEIRNELPYPITDVMIRVPATGGFAGCGNILPRSQCVNRFENVDYRSDAVSISWSERGRAHETGEFRIELPEQAVPGAVYRVRVIVFAPGEAGARLVRDTEDVTTTR
jgi:hypothetical protein